MYICVLSNELCPKNCWMCSMLAPACNRWVAILCLSVCGVMCVFVLVSFMSAFNRFLKLWELKRPVCIPMKRASVLVGL